MNNYECANCHFIMTFKGKQNKDVVCPICCHKSALNDTKIVIEEIPVEPAPIE